MENSFTKFINRIGFYKTTINQIDIHLNEFIKSRKDNLPQNLSSDFVMPILGSKLIYRNVLTAKHEFAYTHFVDMDNVEKTTKEIKENYCNFCISQSFEAFETFLKDILAQYIVCNRNFINSNIKLDLLDTSSFESCRADIYKLLQKDNKYNKQLFNWLYKIDADIEKYEQKNFLRFDFIEWNAVLTEVRHSIVHSNSTLPKEKTRNWTTFQKTLLRELFTKTESDVSIMLSTFENYDYIIAIIAQHGQLIYDRISLPNKHN